MEIYVRNKIENSYWSKSKLQYDLRLYNRILKEIIMLSTDNKASIYDNLAENINSTSTKGLSGSMLMTQTQNTPHYFTV